MKSIIATLLFLAPCLSWAQGTFDFKTKEIDLKDVEAVETPTTVTYKFKNSGSQPIVINRVSPATTLLQASWEREPVAPGKVGDITVTFQSTKLPADFNYTITVFSNATQTREQLKLRGRVVDNPKHPDLLYKVNVDSLKFRTNSISLNEIHPGEVKRDTLYFYNGRQREVTVGIRYTPAHISAIVTPQTLKPGEKGMIALAFDAARKKDYGYMYDNVILSLDNDNSYRNRLSVTARITEDFSKLTPEELANAPVATFEKASIDFGEVEQGAKANCDFPLQNTGKSDLIVRKTKASCGCTAVTMGETVLKPGQTTTIRATFDSTGKNGRQYKSVTVITNDPKQPETVLTLSGNVAAKKISE